jgi:hypothetical protein
MCGGCLAHYGCLTDFAHVAWFAQFALPGEPACGQQRNVPRWNAVFTCDLPRGHDGELHLDKKGNGWGISRHGNSRPPSRRSRAPVALLGRLLSSWRQRRTPRRHALAGTQPG